MFQRTGLSHHTSLPLGSPAHRLVTRLSSAPACHSALPRVSLSLDFPARQLVTRLSSLSLGSPARQLVTRLSSAPACFSALQRTSLPLGSPSSAPACHSALLSAPAYRSVQLTPHRFDGLTRLNTITSCNLHFPLHTPLCNRSMG